MAFVTAAPRPAALWHGRLAPLDPRRPTAMVSGTAKSGKSASVAEGDAVAAATVAPRKLAVLESSAFKDGRYGVCHACGDAIVIPGLAHSLCARCGWTARDVASPKPFSPPPGLHD